MCVRVLEGKGHSRLAELDEILVGSSWRKAPDVQVGFTELLGSTVAAAVCAGAGRSHGVRGWGIGLLQEKSGVYQSSQSIIATLIG